MRDECEEGKAMGMPGGSWLFGRLAKLMRLRAGVHGSTGVGAACRRFSAGVASLRSAPIRPATPRSARKTRRCVAPPGLRASSQCASVCASDARYA
jgi:hypothetical protein